MHKWWRPKRVLRNGWRVKHFVYNGQIGVFTEKRMTNIAWKKSVMILIKSEEVKRSVENMFPTESKRRWCGFLGCGF